MYVEDLDIPAGRFTEAAKRVMDRAVEDSRRRGHSLLTSAHLFLAVAQADWELFAQAMRHAAVNPHHVLRTIDAHLRRIPSAAGCEVRVCLTTKLVCKLALHRAGRAGHPAVEAADLLLALFEEARGCRRRSCDSSAPSPGWSSHASKRTSATSSCATSA